MLVDEVTEELKKKYDVSNIFKEKSTMVASHEENFMPEQTALVKVDIKKENFFNAIMEFFKKIFKKV